jgi:hypothetical protein
VVLIKSIALVNDTSITPLETILRPKSKRNQKNFIVAHQELKEILDKKL